MEVEVEVEIEVEMDEDGTVVPLSIMDVRIDYQIFRR